MTCQLRDTRLRAVLDAVRTRVSRRLNRDERGSILIEAVVFMGIIALAMAGYSTMNASVNRAQRSQTAQDIVAQQAHGMLETAEALEWDQLGFNPAQIGVRTGVTVGTTTYPTVKDAAVAKRTDVNDLLPSATITRAGVTMTQSVDIAWYDAHTSSSPAGTYGSKLVSVVISYKVLGSSTVRTQKFSFVRVAKPPEALMRAVPEASTVELRQQCPRIQVTPTGIRWPAVVDAQRYLLSLRSGTTTLRNQETVAATTPYFNVANQGGYSWLIQPVVDGITYQCSWQEVTS